MLVRYYIIYVYFVFMMCFPDVYGISESGIVRSKFLGLQRQVSQGWTSTVAMV